MAYPTVAFRHSGSVMGIQPINEASTTQKHDLGMVVTAFDQTYGSGKFVYVKGVASTGPGDLCAYDSKNGDIARAVHAGATSIGPCGVAMAALVADTYGWLQIEGAGPVTTGTVLTDVPLYLTSTAGSLDDTVVAGDLVTGIVSRAATSAGYTTCQIDHPSVVALGGASGSNSGDVTLGAFGSTPAAAGASLAAQVLTLQPASAAQPGGITAATFTALTGINIITLTAEAENGGANTIEVEGQISNILGTNAAVAHEVWVRTLSVTSGQGGLSIGAGANPGSLIKADNPATNENVAWITTTAAGHFRFIVTDTAAETCLVQVGATNALTKVLKLTFA